MKTIPVAPLGLSDEEFRQITEMTTPLPFALRPAFLRAMLAEVAAAGVRSPGVIRKIGQKLQLQARFLGAAPINGIGDT